MGHAGKDQLLEVLAGDERRRLVSREARLVYLRAVGKDGPFLFLDHFGDVDNEARLELPAADM